MLKSLAENCSKLELAASLPRILLGGSSYWANVVEVYIMELVYADT